MKKVKSYTSIWAVEKVIYAINDLKLPFPVTFTQMTWFVFSMVFILMFSKIPPLSFIDNALIKYAVIPVAFTWFMSQKTFDGKKPFGFMKSVILYVLRPKTKYGVKTVKLQTEKPPESITVVRSQKYSPQMNLEYSETATKKKGINKYVPDQIH